MRSSPEWTVPPNVRLTTILLCAISKSLKGKPSSGIQAGWLSPDNGCCAKEQEEEEDEEESIQNHFRNIYLHLKSFFAEFT